MKLEGWSQRRAGRRLLRMHQASRKPGSRGGRRQGRHASPDPLRGEQPQHREGGERVAATHSPLKPAHPMSHLPDPKPSWASEPGLLTCPSQKCSASCSPSLTHPPPRAPPPHRASAHLARVAHLQIGHLDSFSPGVLPGPGSSSAMDSTVPPPRPHSYVEAFTPHCDCISRWGL